jgi:antitoxin CcdA
LNAAFLDAKSGKPGRGLDSLPILQQFIHMATHTKSRTNVSIDSALLEAARAQNIKISPLLEEAIREKLSRDASARWLDENKAAIEAYNAEVEGEGLFSDGLRGF